MYDITVDSYKDSYPIVSGRGFKFFYKKKVTDVTSKTRRVC